MRTLIFNGSPRAAGDTAALIDALTSALAGEVRVVDAYGANIAPCVDCRACKAAFRCAVADDMQAVYDWILESDNIVVASPVYFSQLTGRLMDVFSRLQPGFYARRRGEAGFADRPRRGGIMLAGGGSGSPEPAVALARTLLRAMNAREIGPIAASLRTDELPAARDARAISDARALAAFFNARGGIRQEEGE